MKPEIDTEQKVLGWLKDPKPAVFQWQRLAKHSAEIAKLQLDDCVFLGCEMGDDLLAAAAKAKCFVIPRRPDLIFDPFTPGLYTPGELYDKFKDGGYEACLDRRIYLSFMDKDKHVPLPADVDTVLLRRLHDASISVALENLLDAKARTKCVAIMGGHDMERTNSTYTAVAKLALNLTAAGYMILTGGGPGLMEAGNLGAYCAGFDQPEKILETAILRMKDSPKYTSENWLKDAYAAWEEMGKPKDPAKSRNIGIPTWFYGHEPPNLFATDIAKYFENSVREEGLLALAVGGIIFARGNGGTVQEIFQDANQNYYRTIDNVKSPMILFESDYWNPDKMVFDDPNDKRKKVYPVLQKLANEKKFDDYILLTDDPAAIVQFIKDHPPV
ncbi:LOG family protein [Limnoglobus roseus]|uniref:Rossmann fold nucleotide-binding protein n=1 Tax=Limnoglobus roseus TaxID=2598579 RepID=A0A5C1AMI8_9BACT|nr:hypothetical protein [Limnoglobus roseus]QEL19186.1 hypothetical protein PX52LOC_06245 [Limnoglobus roseus]